MVTGGAVPPLDGILPYVALGDAEIARDANGRHLAESREWWLDREKLVEPGLRDAFGYLWGELQLERDLMHDERLDEAMSREH